MLTFVTYAETIVTENRRHERIEQAMRDRAITTATRTAVASDRITAAAGRCVPAAIAGPWSAHAITEVESADPLGVWSWGYPQQPFTWPSWHAMLDWAFWSALCLLAIAHGAVR